MVTVGETAPRVNVAVPACIQKPGVKVASVVAEAVASVVAGAEGAKSLFGNSRDEHKDQITNGRETYEIAQNQVDERGYHSIPCPGPAGGPLYRKLFCKEARGNNGQSVARGFCNTR